MNSKIVLALCLAIFGAKATEYDVKQIRILLNKAIGCMEKYPVLSEEATFQIASAYGSSDIFATVPYPSMDSIKASGFIQKRLENLIAKSVDAHMDDTISSSWWSLYWNYLGDFKFKAGLLTELPPLKKSLDDILNESVLGEKAMQCEQGLINNNPPSNKQRKCSLPCEKQMLDMQLSSEYTPFEKLNYLGCAVTRNCTNISVKKYIRTARHFCSYAKLEVDKMIEYQDTQEFRDNFSIFIYKAAYCASWGLPEFLTPKIALLIFKNLNCSGCIGADDNFKENGQLLTASAINYLMNVFRLLMEQTEISGY